MPGCKVGNKKKELKNSLQFLLFVSDYVANTYII